MLEILANLAQVLGFSLQAAEFMRRRKGLTDTDAALFSLFALTKNAQSWKSLHTRYHPLGIQIHSVVMELSELKSGRSVPKSLNSIAPNSIRELFFDGILNDAVAHFKQNTRKEIKIIGASFNTQEGSHATALEAIKNFDPTLANEFDEISECRQQFLDLHDKFLKYLAMLSGFISLPNWTDVEIKYILDNRSLLSQDLPNIIYITDKILMIFLDIYMRIVDEHLVRFSRLEVR